MFSKTSPYWLMCHSFMVLFYFSGRQARVTPHVSEDPWWSGRHDWRCLPSLSCPAPWGKTRWGFLHFYLFSSNFTYLSIIFYKIREKRQTFDSLVTGDGRNETWVHPWPSLQGNHQHRFLMLSQSEHHPHRKFETRNIRVVVDSELLGFDCDDLQKLWVAVPGDCTDCITMKNYFHYLPTADDPTMKFTKKTWYLF